MIEAESHLKLLSASILDIDKVFEHIDMLSMGIQYQPYRVIPTLLGSDFGVLGHMWSQIDVIIIEEKHALLQINFEVMDSACTERKWEHTCAMCVACVACVAQNWWQTKLVV
jgi:hypothetical protein